MNVDSFLISDYADAINGKLTVVGTFDTILSKKFPAIHPSLSVSMVIHAHQSEAGRTFDVEVRIIDQDRSDIAARITVNAALPNTAPPGLPLRAVLAARIYGITFSREGPYAIEAYIDGTFHAGGVIYVKAAGS